MGYPFERPIADELIEIETRIVREEVREDSILRLAESFFKFNMPRETATKLLEDAFPEHLDMVKNALNKYYG